MAPSRARTRFQADLESATRHEIPNISKIRKGDAEDEFVFIFSHSELAPSQQASIRVMPQDVSGYPADNVWLVYSDDSLPAAVTKELEHSIDKTAGMKIGDMLSNLSRRLRSSLDSSDGIDDQDSEMTDIDAEENDSDIGDPLDLDEPEDDGNNSDDDYDDYDNFDFGYDVPNTGTVRSLEKTPISTLRRIRRDFRAVRDAGFKQARLCGFDEITDCNILSISLRVDKLGLSSETIEAWNLGYSDYIVLLMKYEGNYMDFEKLIMEPANNSRLTFRLRKCSKYKPSIQQAIAAFSSGRHGQDSANGGFGLPNFEEKDDSVLSVLGIGESIDMLLNNSFVSMMKLKHKHHISWDLAKKIHSEMVRAPETRDSTDIRGDLTPVDAEITDHEAKIAPILSCDADFGVAEPSVPLIATRFALRRFVRCTDYCMICHEKVEGNFEALKPYVCGNSLCLFQYMSLGFGPSIDHEIISQPNVVDLLVSFCYAGLQGTLWRRGGVRELPKGLGLLVPNIRRRPAYQEVVGPEALSPPAGQPGGLVQVPGYSLINAVEVTFNQKASTAELNAEQPGSWKAGRWVVVCVPTDTKTTMFHARIETLSWELLNLHIACQYTYTQPSMTAMMTGPLQTTSEQPVDYSRPVKGYMVHYDLNLDDLEDQEKAFSMELVLNTLPSVKDMRSYLMNGRSKQLATWNRITPAAIGLLRWIISSNRSYIVQVDELPNAEGTIENKLGREDERISGVGGWIQFRFAQGSPEKEALFQEALKDVKKAQRTLMAWHGSALQNWHSIIRQGLDYAVTLNGRAYGNGVYFSQQFDYSAGYTTGAANLVHTNQWPQSALRPTAAISLNEIVNLPEKFVETKACFVVQHCHWIQCRYLMVRPQSDFFASWGREKDQSNGSEASTASKSGMEEYVQDPKYVTKGPHNAQLRIPRIAIPSAQTDVDLARRAQSRMMNQGLEESADEDESDLAFILSDDEEGAQTPTATSAPVWSEAGQLPPTPTQQEPQTDFRPGTLNLDGLPRLQPPDYATDVARKTIMRELASLKKVQSGTALHELGWYIDFDKVKNMFQWIVELHSFDPDLPLAQDMKKAGITSIVLEIRFMREFPMSPPFVRVVTPRFLPFIQGGGGHVTAGGAMCMELLTNTGWSVANSLESVLLQVRMAMCSREPQPARLDLTGKGRLSQYGVAEAVDAYTRAARTHGWQVPSDLHEATMQAQDFNASQSSGGFV